MKDLSDEARRLRNAYNRKWFKKNPGKAKQYQIKYWERKATELAPSLKAFELHEQGNSQREIASILGISVGAVNKLLKSK